MAYSTNLFHYSCWTLFFLESYLEGHTCTVHLNDSTSTPKPTPSSLPQGTVLMTTLFSPFLTSHALHTPTSPYTQMTRPLYLSPGSLILYAADSL